MMREMRFVFEGEVKSNNNNNKKKLRYEQDSNFVVGNNLISSPLFHKVGKKYIYENLGRNGENITTNAGTNTNVRINTYDFLRSIDVQLQYDKLGRLNLGELKNVRSVKINSKEYNLQEYSKYCYPERVDIIPGECFTLPVYSNKKISIN